MKKYLKIITPFVSVFILVVSIFGSFARQASAGDIWAAQNDSGIKDWKAITSSSDGTRLAAVVNNGKIYTSDNKGETWSSQNDSPTAWWSSIASDSTGQYLVASAGSCSTNPEILDYIYTSDDFGVSWTQITSEGAGCWTSVSSSADGTKLAASNYWDQRIHTSSNGGINWVTRSLPGMWLSIDSDASGDILVAAAGQISTGSNSSVHRSTNQGLTWSQMPLTGDGYIKVSQSANGNKIAVMRRGFAATVVSTNAGVSWANTTLSAFSGGIDYSADGSKLIIAGYDSYISVSSDDGATWTNQTSLGTHKWQSAVSNSTGSNFAATAFANTGDYIYTYPITNPTLSTQPATSITSTNATLNGTIADSGGTQNTIRGFEYGLDTNYGQTVSNAGLFSKGEYSEYIYPTCGGITYHYRSYSTNIAGTGYGDDVTFTTGACVNSIPVVTLPTVASRTQTSAVLGATVSSLGYPSVITERGTCWGASLDPVTNCSAEGATSLGLFTHSRNGFVTNTTYHYRGYATNATGTAYSPDATFTTINSVLGGTVDIIGSPKFGQTLTADISNITYTNTPPSSGDVPTYAWGRWTGPHTGGYGSPTVSSYTLTEADIGFMIAVNVSADNIHATGSVASAKTAFVSKADGPSAPSAPTLSSSSTTSITLTPNVLNEFSKDDGVTWQNNIFTGLNPSTSYTFVSRVKETSTTNASVKSTSASFSTDASPSITPISSASLTGFVAPVTSSTPQLVGTLSGQSSYTITSLNWSPAHNPYQASTVYTASVLLTSNTGYKFQAGGFTPTVNTGTSQAGVVGGGDVEGNTLTFSVVFPQTSANPTQETPTFSPTSSAVTFPTDVTIISAGADAIYYTTNGSTPTISSTNQATTPLVVNQAMTVKALAVKSGYSNSAIGQAVYTELLPSMSGTVTITGTTKYNQTLTANISGLTYTPNTSSDVPTYQWKRGGTNITNATLNTYTLVEADIGQTITVTVTADGVHATGYVTSSATSSISKADGPSAPSAPILSSKTSSSVILTSNTLHQFTKDDGTTWQDSNTFSGLVASTLYTFKARVKATSTTNESVKSTGTDITTDAPTLPTLTTSPATSLNRTVATLNGSITDTGGVTIDSKEFEYGLTTAYGTTVPSDALTFTASLSNLTCNTTYHYRANATNSVGTTNGNDVSFTTTSCASSGGSGGGGGGATTPTVVVCNIGQKYNLTTGKLCNSFTATPNTPSTTPTLTRTLKLTTPRMSGNDVKELQVYLTSKGYDVGTPDGIFGTKSSIAIAKFQRENGLKADGVLGPVTRALLFNTPSIPTTPTPPSTTPTLTRTLKLTTPRMSGNDVKELQVYLTSKGYDVGTPDGIFGTKSSIAIAKFQRENGLKADGVLGPMTRGLLFK